MVPRSFMFIAGEASGDRLAAGLVGALREEWSRRQPTPAQDFQPLHKGFGPAFFGAGGEALRGAGVELIEDTTQHAVIGLSEVLRKLGDFRRLLSDLQQAAVQRLPDVIVCVDYGGFNLLFAAAIRRMLRRANGFHNWQPKIVQFVSPQVWGSRPWRAKKMERNLDLLISLYPFEPAWFAQRTPKLKVTFVGHPLATVAPTAVLRPPAVGQAPLVLLLPGSRNGELRRHLPLMIEATQRIRQAQSARFQLIVPTEALAKEASRLCAGSAIDVTCGGLESVLPDATLAISKTGTVATQLALHGVPGVTLYKTSLPTYLIGRQLVTVKWLSMPNILANEALFPEFVQHAATPEAVAAAALALLQDESRRTEVSRRLRETVAGLHNPSAYRDAASAILDLFA